MAADNKILGQFDLVGIPPAARGMPQVEVTFDIDANGIVNVSAKDKATGKEQQVRIQASGGLSDSDIQQMVKDAEAHADEDKKRRAAVDARNSADSLIHQTEKNLKEHGDKMAGADKSEIEAKLAAVKDVLDSGDAEKIKTATDALLQASMKMGEAMYKQDPAAGGGEQTASGGGESAGGKEDVVDADFEEVDKNKK
jgi:molecular chaperone DnaK